MRIFLIQQGVDVSNIVNPISTYDLSRDSDAPHAALTLDQYMFGARQTVDWVLFTKHENVKFEEFSQAEKYFPRDTKTILSANKNTVDCFYCRPEIYTIVGNLYKSANDIYFMLAKHRMDIHWL